MANKRFPVSMNEQLLEKVDKVCEEMSTSRNSFINFIVASYIKGENQVQETVRQMLEEKITELMKDDEE